MERPHRSGPGVPLVRVDHGRVSRLLLQGAEPVGPLCLPAVPGVQTLGDPVLPGAVSQ